MASRTTNAAVQRLRAHHRAEEAAVDEVVRISAAVVAARRRREETLARLDQVVADREGEHDVALAALVGELLAAEVAEVDEVDEVGEEAGRRGGCQGAGGHPRYGPRSRGPGTCQCGGPGVRQGQPPRPALRVARGRSGNVPRLGVTIMELRNPGPPAGSVPVALTPMTYTWLS